MLRIVIALALIASAGACSLFERGDPTPALRADLAREDLVVELHDLTVELVDRVTNWTPEQRQAVRERVGAYLDRYRPLATACRDYLEATGAPNWREIAGEALVLYRTAREPQEPQP